MATIDLGKLGFVNKGTYNSSTSYEKNDLVQYTDSSILSTYLYINAAAATGQTPSTSGTVNGTYWAYYAKGGAAGADGTNVATTLTTQGDILYRDGSGLQRLPKGTAGQVLKMNASANAPEYGTLSSDFVKIAGGNTTSSGTIDITGCFSTDYKFYKLFINHNFVSQAYLEVGLLKASDNSLDTSTYYVRANGSYSDSGSGTGRWTAGANQNTYNQTDSDGFRVINTWNSFQADEHSMVEMTFDNPFAARKTMMHSIATWSQSSYVGVEHAVGMHDDTVSNTGLRIGSAAGSDFTTTGYYAVYGLKN